MANSTTSAKAGERDRDHPLYTHSDLVTYPAQPHALPFRTILGEYFERRPVDLAGVSAKILIVKEPKPFDPSDNHSKSEWGKFSNQQWHLLQEYIQDSENAYRNLAAEKEKLAALSTDDFPALAEAHKQRIAQLASENEALKKRISAAAGDSKQKLINEQQEKEKELREEQKEKKEDKFQARIAKGYQDVLAAEGKCRDADKPLLRVMHAMNGSAVCLSGGGIRSASFCLGVLQGLARFSVRREPKPSDTPASQVRGHSVLEGLDYLSTVSGGGYIGSWLMAWATHANYQKVVKLLAYPADTASDPEPQPLRHLREYTSYLTPHYGFTLDSLTVFAIVLRNLFLNWMILVPALVFLFCAPEFLYQVSAFVTLCLRGWVSYAALGVATLLGSGTMLFIAQSTFKPYYASEMENPEKLGRTSREVYRLILPLMVGAWILAEGWASASQHGFVTCKSPFLKIVFYFATFAIVPPMAMAAKRVKLLWPRPGVKDDSPLRRHDLDHRGNQLQQQTADEDAIVDWWRVSWALTAPLLIGIAIAFALAACARHTPLPNWSAPPTKYDAHRMFVWLCLPVVWSVLLLGSALLSGLLCGIETEEEREWWARAGGLIIMFALGWVSLVGLSFFATDAPALVDRILVATGLASGYLGSRAGMSAATSSGLKKVKLDQLTTIQRWLAKNDLLAPLACAIAVVCLSLALAAGTTWLHSAVSGLLPDSYPRLVSLCFDKLNLHVEATTRLTHDFVTNLVIALCALALAFLANAFINVNTFSLQGMYRMRLTRAYLGASNFARHPDNFTNFDKRDNLHESDLVHRHAPLHVINTALNLVATSNLAWQQRKAESFTFTPLNAGCWRLGYLPTALYGDDRGVTLGTAMSISGAAFNPNMGYHSSPLVTLLMTFFNARLGWWLPNPMWPVLEALKASGDPGFADSPLTVESLLRTDHPNPAIAKRGKKFAKFLRRAGPVNALFTLIYEALGRTDDKYKWIELTDGGHFENLGLYEMVMRRCRYIIVIDADADSDFEFEDLGNAIRKIEIDFGIPIRFPQYPNGFPMKYGVDASNGYCVVGDIHYECVDTDVRSCCTSEQQGISMGTLLYIKPCLNGSEPLGVKAYANSHPKFPHESTVNQFFNESQFESYRNLGSWEFGSIVEDFSPDSPGPGNDIETLFDFVS
jgi:hypothetical protein